MMNLILMLSFLFVCHLALAHASYDEIQITPDRWEKVYMTYMQTIDGKKYPASLQLLRPIGWLKDRGIDQVGDVATLSLLELEADNVAVTVQSIKPTSLDTSKIDWEKRSDRPVIGIFKHWGFPKSYSVEGPEGHKETLHVTPNHMVFVKKGCDHKDCYLPIAEVGSDQKLLSETGQMIKLICPTGRKVGCGEEDNKKGQPTQVYNLEVYKKHIYFVGKKGIKVHNSCASWIRNRWRRFRANRTSQEPPEEIPMGSTGRRYATIAPKIPPGHRVVLPREEISDLTRITYQKGKWVYNKGGKSVRSLEGTKTLYVMDTDGIFYVLPEDYWLRHLSFSNLDIASAGEARFERGVLREINFNSGSYRPSYQNALNTIDALNKLDPKITSVEGFSLDFGNLHPP